MPAINQEINIIFNALVRKLQDVRELNKEIHELKSSDKAPVIIDEKISKNAKQSAGDVRQLQTSIDSLTAAIAKMDDQKVGRLGRLLTVLGGIATILGHLKAGHEGIQVLKTIVNSSPSLSNASNGIASFFTKAAGGIRSFFNAAKEKGANALAAVKENVSALASNLPGLASTGITAAGGLAALGLTAGVAAVALGGILAVVIAIVAAFVALPALGGILLNLANSTADAGAKFHDLNQETGVSVELLSSLAPVADDSNGSIDDLARGIGKFNKLVGEASNGSKEAIATLKEFGLKPKEALADSEAALEKVFKRIIALPPGIQQAIAAQKAFGKSGADLIPTIIATGGNLEAVKRKAQELGVYWTHDGANAADEYGDKINELRRIINGLGQSIGRVLIPELVKLLRIFTSEGSSAGAVFQVVINAIALGIKGLTRTVMVLIAALNTLRGKAGVSGDSPNNKAFGGSTETGLEEAASRARGDGSFMANLREVVEIAHTAAPDVPAGTQDLDFPGSKGGKGKKPGQPASTFESELAFRAANAQRLFDREKDLIARLTEIYKTALDDRKIATEDFFDASETLRERELRAELKLQQELNKIETARLEAEQKKIAADPDTTKAQKAALNTNALNQSLAAIAPIISRTHQLEQDLAELPGKTEAAEKAALASLDDQISEFLAKVDEANGRTAAAAADAIDREFKELLERVSIEQGENSPLVKLIKEFIQVQKDRARVAQIDQRVTPLQQQFDIDRLDVEAKISRHVITQREGRKQINALQKKYLESLLEVYKLELANTTEAKTQLEIKLKIAGAEAELANLDEEVDATAKSINDSLRGGLEDFFSSIADGTKSIKEAFGDLGRFILQMFARLAAAKLVQSIFGKLLGGADDEDGKGGLGGILSSFFGGKKAAGDVISARPGGQFINVAEGGFDEFVVTTDPRHRSRTAALLGRFINRTGILPNLKSVSSSLAGSLVPSNRFAMGGLALAAAGAAPNSAGESHAPRPLNLKQVLVYDPRHVHDAMRSSGGEEVFLNFIDRNATLIRRRLKI